MTTYLRKKIIIGFSLFSGILLIISALTLWNYHQFSENKRDVDRGEEVLSEIKTTLSLLIDIEAGQRGYIITGNSAFLEQYNNARLKLPKAISVLENNLTDPESLDDFRKLQRISTAKIALSERVIQTRINEGLKASAKIIGTTEGKRLMDEIRITLDRIDVRLRTLLDKKLLHSSHNINITFWITVFGLLCSLILLIFGSIYLIRSISLPISELTKGADKFSRGDFSHNIPLYREDEFGVLTKAYNDMASKILILINKSKHFTDLLQNLAFTSVSLGNMAMSTEANINNILHDIADKAKSLINADYAAIGIGSDPTCPFSPWAFSGMDEKDLKAIGRPPRPVGLLGWVAVNGESIRLNNLKENSIFQGFPENHPNMGPLLGVPIRHQGKPIGNLYLTRKDVNKPFTEEDQQAIGLLASQVGIILENTNLHIQLRQSIASRQDLLAIVSHDLRNPLTVISMNAELLKKRAGATEESSWILKASSSIESASFKMRRMISDLLDAAAVESGKVQINPASYRVQQILDELKSQFAPIAENKKIKFEVNDQHNHLALFCDMDRIQQVFSNLIGNSFKFTPEGGNVAVSSSMKEENLIFTVSDTGPGISDENQKHLFDRYWQIKDTKAKGTGLGLFIAKGIVVAHGSDLKVESHLGVGTSFSFALPITDR